MRLLYGRIERLTAKNGGFRPGQCMVTAGDGCVDFDEFVGSWWREGKLSAVEKLDRKWKQFRDRFDWLTAQILVAGGATKLADRQRNLVVLEVGAGVVVPSIRRQAEHLAAAGLDEGLLPLFFSNYRLYGESL
jgi:hypothetical protein